jgi:hypothetical protein
MTVRHAIMQVSYYVRIRTIPPEASELLGASQSQRRWIPVEEADRMALTGLARKVLMRAHLLRSHILDDTTEDPQVEGAEV